MPDLFDTTASYYAHYRLEPPREIIDELKTITDVNGQGRLLDVGCGPGTSTFLFAPFFKDIIALDSSHAMIQEGKRQASKRNITNIRWICSPVETVNINLIGQVDIVIFANSFHWMDQALVLRRFKDTITKGGVIMGGGSPWNKEQEHDRIIVRTIREFLGDQRKTVQGNYKEPTTSFKEIIENSPFTFIKRKLLKFTHEFTVDDLIGWQLSTSYANERLLGSRKEEFVTTLRKRLEGICRNGKISSEESFEVIHFSK